MFNTRHAIDCAVQIIKKHRLPILGGRRPPVDQEDLHVTLGGWSSSSSSSLLHPIPAPPSSL
eukprot:5394663-Pyramimonas_sp.AAC.1